MQRLEQMIGIGNAFQILVGLAKSIYGNLRSTTSSFACVTVAPATLSTTTYVHDGLGECLQYCTT
jgi:hypothetical protein